MSKLLSNGQPQIGEVRAVGIVKRFPGVLANDHVDFDVKAGEIHALLGENGAGKSTLMRQLYGLYQPDEGKILIDGVEHRFHSPKDAIRAGIGMIHQHFMLVPELTVVENVALGLKSSRGFVLDLDVVEKRVCALAEQYGLKIDPKASVWQLAVGEQQRVEIIKALYRGAAVLILDEPTAVLTPQEVDDLFVTLRQMAAEGHALVFISHKLHEVLAISDRVTVLRDGRVVGKRPTQGATKEELAQMMVGRPVILQYDMPPLQCGDTLLKIEDLFVQGDRGVDAVAGLSLELHAGEILGLAGVSGNGQRELAQALTGLRPVRKGRVLLHDKDVTNASPSERMALGLSYIPEERMKEGAIRDFSVADNIILQDHHKPPYVRSIFFDFKAIKNDAKRLVEAFNVKTPTLDTPIKNLSGGNIQKLIMGRELWRRPSVLIAAQPTRGVDIGASEYIHQQLLGQRNGATTVESSVVQRRTPTQAGMEMREMLEGRREQCLATLLISEDLDEIRALSDRIAVIYEGKIVGIVDRNEATVEQLGLMMAGVRKEEALGLKKSGDHSEKEPS
ncbi:MAG: ABC transporter ATP-binding protein [Anaerolineae bacterium]|nr:ABC transporter ATP-binding protein [Anaerolineae bacterium]